MLGWPRCPGRGRRSPAGILLGGVSSLAGWVIIAAIVAGCGRKPGVGPAPSSGELPDQEVREFVLTETDEGALQWKLFARWAAMYDARNLIVARGVRVDFYDQDGRKTSELRANEGEINQVSRDMSASGNVRLLTTEGTRMSTERLRFVNRTQKVVSDVLVRVERDGNVLSGFGFESDPDLRHYEFKRQVNAVVRTRSGGVIAPGGSR